MNVACEIAVNEVAFRRGLPQHGFEACEDRSGVGAKVDYVLTPRDAIGHCPPVRSTGKDLVTINSDLFDPSAEAQSDVGDMSPRGSGRSEPRNEPRRRPTTTHPGAVDGWNRLRHKEAILPHARKERLRPCGFPRIVHPLENDITDAEAASLSTVECDGLTADAETSLHMPSWGVHRFSSRLTSLFRTTH
jgi:hypothetical protein